MIVMPDTMRIWTDFKTFAAKHNILLNSIHIWNLINKMWKRGSTVILRARRRRGVRFVRKLGEKCFLAKIQNYNNLFNFILWEYRVGMYVYILHLQICICNDSPYYLVDLRNKVQMINSFCCSFVLPNLPITKIIYFFEFDIYMYDVTK